MTCSFLANRFTGLRAVVFVLATSVVLFSSSARAAQTLPWDLNTGDATTVCSRFQAMWKTNYAPGDYTDVNYTSPTAVATGYNYASCVAGSVQQLFLDDALRRMNFYRWITGLQYATIDATIQVGFFIAISHVGEPRRLPNHSFRSRVRLRLARASSACSLFANALTSVRRCIDLNGVVPDNTTASMWRFFATRDKHA